PPISYRAGDACARPQQESHAPNATASQLLLSAQPASRHWASAAFLLQRIASCWIEPLQRGCPSGWPCWALVGCSRMQRLSPPCASLLSLSSGAPSVQLQPHRRRPAEALMPAGRDPGAAIERPEASTVALRSHRSASPFWIILLLRLPAIER